MSTCLQYINNSLGTHLNGLGAAHRSRIELGIVDKIRCGRLSRRLPPADFISNFHRQRLSQHGSRTQKYITAPYATTLTSMFASGMQDILGQEMVKDRDKLQQRIKDLQAILSQAQSVQNNTGTSSSQRGGDSWASYSKWNDYDDVEDLEVEIGTAKEALKKLNVKISGHNTDDSKTCNHRYQCSCIGDKSVERKVVQMTTQKRLDEMTSFKIQGNEIFGQQKYNEALNLYEKTLV